jgi:hypothetical protein
MAPASYPRAVGVAALQAVLSGVWIAAGELTPARRRLTRVGAVAVMGAVTLAVSPPSDLARSSVVVLDAQPRLLSEVAPAPAEPTLDKRRIAATAGLLGVAVAVNVGRYQFRKRWLAKLTRDGHPHPTRALAVRMAAFEFAHQLALQIRDRRRAARAS